MYLGLAFALVDWECCLVSGRAGKGVNVSGGFYRALEE